FVTSGVRIGTPAVTTQGMGTDEMVVIGDLIAQALRDRDDAAAVAGVKMEAEALCSRFQPYPELGA
ncbi:MAG: serine hydroxymethyltransferase, partial [Actinomycetota bacterium]